MVCKMSENLMQVFSTQQKQESEFMKILTDYLERNPKIGYIKFKVYEMSPANQPIPVSNAMVTVNKHIGEGYYVTKVVFTDSNGETESIPFFTVDKKYSMIPGYVHPFETYDAQIQAPNHITTDLFNIQVYDGITETQTVILSPKLE